jgi:hypothetical protein
MVSVKSRASGATEKTAISSNRYWSTLDEHRGKDEMHKHAATALIISGLTALGVYRYRRGLASRLLGLPPALHDVAVERGLRVPMPDGVELGPDQNRR